MLTKIFKSVYQNFELVSSLLYKKVAGKGEKRSMTKLKENLQTWTSGLIKIGYNMNKFVKFV